MCSYVSNAEKTPQRFGKFNLTTEESHWSKNREVSDPPPASSSSTQALTSNESIFALHAVSFVRDPT